MEAPTATAAKAHRSTKRALGLLRGAARLLAEASADVDLIAEVDVRGSGDVQSVAELLRLELSRRPELEVLILARPRGSSTRDDDRGRTAPPE